MCASASGAGKAVVPTSAEIDGLRYKSPMRITTERAGIMPTQEVRIGCTFTRSHLMGILRACSVRYQTNDMCIYIVYILLSPLETGIRDCEKQVMLIESQRPKLV